MGFLACIKRSRRHMALYTPIGPFNQGGAPGINKTFLDGVENALVAAPATYFITPFHLTTNPTVNSGATTNLTCTGVGGIPSGAKAVWVACQITCSAAATSCNLYPTGVATTGYPQISAPVASQFFEVPVLVP